MTRYYYIYIITNTITQKSYVGSRMYDRIEPYWGSSEHLKKDINIYGLWNFSKQVIEIYPFIDKYELANRETEFILKFNTLNPSGYNYYLPNRYPRFYMIGYHHTEKTKKKLSKSHIGKLLSEEHKNHISESHIGEIFSEERKQNISAKLKNRTLSKEHKNHLSESHTGKTLPDEQKQKISAKLKGRVPWNKGKKTDPITIEKRVSKLRGIPRLEETRKKISETKIKRKIKVISLN